MDINYLLQLLGNRLNGLTLAKDQAFQSGDLERINAIDAEILGVKNTISKLELITSIEQTAVATAVSEAEVVKNGIEASLSAITPNVIFNGDPTSCLLGYDISSYATDPLHEEKIADILNYIGEMDSPEKIDTYIQNETIGSPITGSMIYNSANKYKVDARLMMAIMELDSRFGTAGIAIGTLNPGNVGNNDAGETHTYRSWDEGVEAVAKWLDNHRVSTIELEEENIQDEEDIENVENTEEENKDESFSGENEEIIEEKEEISDSTT